MNDDSSIIHSVLALVSKRRPIAFDYLSLCAINLKGHLLMKTHRLLPTLCVRTAELVQDHRSSITGTFICQEGSWKQRHITRNRMQCWIVRIHFLEFINQPSYMQRWSGNVTGDHSAASLPWHCVWTRWKFSSDSVLFLLSVICNYWFRYLACCFLRHYPSPFTYPSTEADFFNPFGWRFLWR